MQVYKFIATFFGVGYLPKAPGTFGALAALLISILIHRWFGHLFTEIHAILIIIFYFAGTIAGTKLQVIWGKDPQKIVIDEVVGTWISFMFLPTQFWTFLGGFVLFRFFDIVKPLGIRKIDALPHAHGIMLDDVVAGIYANICMQLIYHFSLIN